MTFTNETAFFTALLIAIVLLAGYLEWSYARGRLMRRRANRIAHSLDRDEAFNATVTSRAIMRNMKMQGYDVSEVEGLMVKAEADIEEGRYREARELSIELRNRLLSIRNGGHSQPVNEHQGEEGRLEVDEKATETEEVAIQARKLPRNYAEASFTIRSVKEDIEKNGGNRQAEDALLLAEKAFEEGRYDEALMLAVKARKLLGEGETTIQVIESEHSAAVETDAAVCTQCGSPMKAGDGFCRKCGKPAVANCPKCGSAAEEGDVFCGKCGTKLSA